MSTPTWKEVFELPDISYFVSDIQGHFKYIFKEPENVTDNYSLKIWINTIEKKSDLKLKEDIILNF